MLELLAATEIRAFGITQKACEKLLVTQAKTRHGIKFAASFAEKCYKVLNLDGTYYWEGDYDPSLGLFGQKAAIPDEPLVLVTSDFEVMKLVSLGYNAVCLAEPRMADDLTFALLEENLASVTRNLYVWEGSNFAKRSKALERFLMFLARQKKYKISSLLDSESPILTLKDDEIKGLLDTPKLEPWKPKGLTTVSAVLKRDTFRSPVESFPSHYPCLNEAINGYRLAEVVMFAAGTGVGKSTIVEEEAYEIGTRQGVKTGLCFLENPDNRTVMRLASIRYSVPLDELRKNPNLLTQKQWEEMERATNKNYVIYNHFGSLESDALFTRIEYMIDFEGCKFIILDHISIAISGISSKEGERKDIDILMTKLATLAVAKNVAFLCVTHLSQPEGIPHEEGGRVTLSQLRGSGSIKQLSWTVIAQERNQQSEYSTHTLVRLLKCRETGKSGPIGVLKFNRETGRLEEDPSWPPLEFEQVLQPRRAGNKGAWSPQNSQKNSFGNFKEMY